MRIHDDTHTGKSTLLRILAGKRLMKGEIAVLGKNPFFEGSQLVTYLDVDWGTNPVVRRDVPVSRLLASLGAERHSERCAELLDILDVNPHWNMHQLSEGQRRRVQLLLGLMCPWEMLLLDEVTVDLDVLVRADLLRYLKRETETRPATILYATHIFDGLGGWPTHVAHMSNGGIQELRAIEEFPEFEACKAERMALAQVPGQATLLDTSPLLMVVERWLRADAEAAKATRDAASNGEAPRSKWDILSENMKEYGDKYYNYWR